MILVRQTNQHVLFTGKHMYINTKFVKGNSRGRGYNCLTEESIVHGPRDVRALEVRLDFRICPPLFTDFKYVSLYTH